MKIQRSTGDNGKKRECSALIRVVPPVSGPLGAGGVPPFSFTIKNGGKRRKRKGEKWQTRN